ncbi:unnamed protein product [Protopolystoma xenopodis]|uniref:CCR4-NOT transcription complex subunit 10 n=1 Tax=Protopolystoma xenopodis TaxID=117903 RepID=A0A448WGH8_9PLAT|nr:unnamed protein product [Protopolystoma xenopodis]
MMSDTKEAREEALGSSALKYSADERLFAIKATSFFIDQQYEKCFDLMKRLSSTRLDDPKIQSAAKIFCAPLPDEGSLEQTSSAFLDTKSAAGEIREQSNATFVTSSRTTIAITLHYNYALLLFYQRQVKCSEALLANILNVYPTDCREDPKKEFSKFSELLNFKPCSDLVLCRRVILLWLEVLLRLHKAELVYQICSKLEYQVWGTLTVYTQLFIVNSLADELLPSFEQVKKKTGAHTLPSSSSIISVTCEIRLPLKLLKIRSCLLTGRLIQAEWELAILNLPKSTKSIELNTFSGSNPDSVNEILTEKSEFSASEESSTSCLNGQTKDELSDKERFLDAKSKSQANWDTGNCLHFLNAQLAYLKASHLLGAIPPSCRSPIEAGQCETSMIWNNLALLHHRASQISLSGLHLRRAMCETDKVINEALSGSNNQKTGRFIGCCSHWKTTYNYLHHDMSTQNLLHHKQKFTQDKGTFWEARLSEVQWHHEVSSYNHGKNSTISSHIVLGDLLDIMIQVPLRAFSLSQHHALLYNAGIQLLSSGRASAAFNAFLELTQFYPSNPRLWFRLAESCIHSHRFVFMLFVEITLLPAMRHTSPYPSLRLGDLS